MTAPNGRSRVASLVTVGAAIVFVTASCNEVVFPLDDPFQGPQPVLNVKECPHTWDIRAYTSADSALPTANEFARSIRNVPEYHDCQRLIDTSGAYGPLVGAFAREDLGGIGTQLSLLAADDLTTKKALALVELWNVDTVVYEPLKILPGFSCLYVEKRNGNWRGKLVRYGWPQPNCTGAIDLDQTAGLSLTVVARPTTSTDFEPEDFPPVVRWEWDETHKHQYLGFKCDATTWCEAGLDGFVSAPSLTTAPAAPRKMRRTLEIRGWLDQQQLAHYPAEGPPVPAPVRGTVIPHHDLKDRGWEAYGTHEWRPVAYVQLDIGSDVYATKLNFIPKAPENNTLSPANTTTVSICWAGAATCPDVPDTPCVGVGEGQIGAGKWWAKFEAPGRDPIFTCVKFQRHPLAHPATPNVHTLGTVRWRWIVSDETIWVGCPDGCCYSGGT